MRSRCAPRSKNRLRAVVVALALCGGATLGLTQSAAAQGLDRGSVISPVLTIDSERLFLESDFGRRVAAQAEVRGNELSAENRKIEADLEKEELDLTEKRATLTPEEFRDLADAFDVKVQDTRALQTAKGRAINEELERARAVFLDAAGPVLERLMRDSGAAVILERRSVFVSAAAVEITDDAIALLNDTLDSSED